VHREIKPREAQYLPSIQCDRVLTHPVTLERRMVAVERPSVDLDRDALPHECDIDHVASDGMVGSPPRDARIPEQSDEQSLGVRPGSVTCRR